MSMRTLIKRNIPIQSIQHQLNGLQSADLPYTIFRGLDMMLALTHTNSGAAPNLAGLLGVINKLQLTINGADQIMSLPAWCLFYINRAEFGVQPQTELHTTVSMQGTSYISFYLPFSLLKAINANDTMLDGRFASSVRLECQWAGLPPNVASIASGELQLDSVEYALPPEIQPGLGKHEFAYLTKALTKTGTNQIQLDTGIGNQYRRLWIFTKDDSGALSDAEIDNVAVKSRNFYYIDQATRKIHASNNRSFGISAQTGLYVVDFPTDGRMSERVQTYGMSDLTVELNALKSTGEVHIVAEKVILPTPKAAA